MNTEKDSIASYLSKVVSNEQSVSKHKVDVRIAGNIFTVSANESEEYILAIAKYVDQKISSVSNAGKLPLTDAAILACCNLADEQFKDLENMKELRLQLKAYQDDVSRLRTEINTLHKELEKAKQE